MRARLKDVAALANVSAKTVSNVINGYAYLRPETRARVERAIQQLDYRPNINARNLRRGRTGLIALALPGIGNPYFSELAHLIVGEARRHGLTVLIDCTDGAEDRERRVADGLHEHVIDGLILLPRALSADQLGRRRDPAPLVLLGEAGPGYADSVAIDSRAAARAATDHLVNAGRRRIAVIGGAEPVQRPVQRLRMDGYRDSLRAAGLTPDPELAAVPDRYTSRDGASAMARLLDADVRPDAVFCHNDLLALGAIRTLLARGLRVPEDVAVIGIDDIDVGRHTTPTLSTVSPDKTYVARCAVRMLVERFASGSGDPPRRITAGFTLVTRESTACPSGPA